MLTPSHNPNTKRERVSQIWMSSVDLILFPSSVGKPRNLDHMVAIMTNFRIKRSRKKKQFPSNKLLIVIRFFIKKLTYHPWLSQYTTGYPIYIIWLLVACNIYIYSILIYACLLKTCDPILLCKFPQLRSSPPSFAAAAPFSSSAQRI